MSSKIVSDRAVEQYYLVSFISLEIEVGYMNTEVSFFQVVSDSRWSLQSSAARSLPLSLMLCIECKMNNRPHPRKESEAWYGGGDAETEQPRTLDGQRSPSDIAGTNEAGTVALGHGVMGKVFQPHGFANLIGSNKNGIDPFA